MGYIGYYLALAAFGIVCSEISREIASAADAASQ